jgi:phosphoglycolate phosphatase-like HAD superfamily hydrolase
MVHRLCEQVGVAPADTVVVGDAVADVLMGREAGVALTVGVLTGVTTAADFAGHADVVVASLAELVPV